MNTEAYWYYKDGRLGQHIIPPTDPSEVSFIKVTTTDIPYKRVQAEITQCIEGKYHKPEIIISKPYENAKDFREHITNHIKAILKIQRQITEWGIMEYRNKQQNKNNTRRGKNGRK